MSGRPGDWLDQEAMIVPYNLGSERVELHPICSLASIAELEIENTFSSEDGEHHPEQVVLLTDGYPFDEEGNFFFKLK
jgi:hypothetical protein